MTATDDLIRTLTSFPGLALRVLWLQERLTKSSHSPHQITQWAIQLDQLMERSLLAEDRARDALLAVTLTLIQEKNRGVREQLREQAQLRSLLHLERLVREGPAPPNPPENEAPVPQYRTGRDLTVGERRSLARRPSRADLERLLFDPHPLVFEQLLHCPSLTEQDLLRFCAQRPLPPAPLSALVQSFRWMARRRIRLTLLSNPSCPAEIALPLVSTCPREDLELVLQNTTLSAQVRTVAWELTERLPPLPERPGSTLQ